LKCDSWHKEVLSKWQLPQQETFFPSGVPGGGVQGAPRAPAVPVPRQLAV